MTKIIGSSCQVYGSAWTFER